MNYLKTQKKAWLSSEFHLYKKKQSVLIIMEGGGVYLLDYKIHKLLWNYYCLYYLLAIQIFNYLLIFHDA